MGVLSVLLLIQAARTERSAGTQEKYRLTCRTKIDSNTISTMISL